MCKAGGYHPHDTASSTDALFPSLLLPPVGWSSRAELSASRYESVRRPLPMSRENDKMMSLSGIETATAEPTAENSQSDSPINADLPGATIAATAIARAPEAPDARSESITDRSAVASPESSEPVQSAVLTDAAEAVGSNESAETAETMDTMDQLRDQFAVPEPAVAE